MASDVQIANYALTKLGASPILALTDDNVQGRTLNRIFTLVRDAELRRGRWNFAIKRTTLLALVAEPEWSYSLQYPLPVDFLSLVQVNDTYIRPFSKQKTLWQVENGAIVTDLIAPLKVRYVYRVTNSALFDPLFVEAFACKLAFEACEAITNSAQKKQALGEAYKEAMMEARSADAIENPPDELPWGSWLESREGYDYGLSADAAGTIYGAGTYVA